VTRALVIVIALAAIAHADRTLLKEGDAAKTLFGAGARAEKKTLELSDAQTAAVGKALGRTLATSKYPYLAVADERGAALGVIFLLDVIGQSQPITFAVAVAADGALRDVAVVVYRESHGDEIADKRFRKQFAGKRLADPIALGKDIDAITGATISSRSATFAARKALYLDQQLRAKR
jgi:Na+-translocating ferredoxin:NAD+ oxidoreductase RnfG subunit